MKPIRFSQAALAAVAAVALASCQQASTPAGESAKPENAGPETKPGLELTNGVLMLPVVKGRPGAAYFRLANGGMTSVILAGVHIDGAGNAEIHETRAGTMAKIEELELGANQSVEFERGGLHVMAFELSPELGTGEGQKSETEITLTFADGDKLSAPLAVEKMGSAMEHGMAGGGR